LISELPGFVTTTITSVTTARVAATRTTRTWRIGDKVSAE
jgi:hypothetical protein